MDSVIKHSRPAKLFLVLVFVTVLAFTSPVLVEALCAAQDEDGSWTSADPNTRGLTRAELRFVCQDQIRNGQLYPPGPPWYIHLWGKCHPNDCDWGEVGARRLDSGYVYAEYNHGFARRYVYARMSLYRPGQLWIWMWTDFTDPGRADYAWSGYFLPS